MKKNGLRRTASLAVTLCAAAASMVWSQQNIHPSYAFKRILPDAMKSIGGIGGIGLLPNGDGVICTWGGSQKSDGELWIVEKLASGTPGTATRIATGMREPLGVKVIGNDFYVLEKPRINKYVGSGTTWTKTTIFSLPTAWYDDAQWHHFSFNLEFRDNALWFTTGTAYDYTPNDPLQRGALIRVPIEGGSFTQLARGLRNTDGLGIGPENEFFITDNQGHWKPVDVMYHVPTKDVPTNGRFYGFRTNTNNACGIQQQTPEKEVCPADPEYPPAIWIPYGGGISNSPTRPILLKSGPYAGQMIGGDVYAGGILRYFLEKVEGEYQGAVFQFIKGSNNGINYGINQFIYTPDTNLIVAGIGGGVCGLGGSGNWAYNGQCRGLDFMTPTTQVPFDILAIRSTPTGFELEFTEPANDAAGTASNYSIKTSVFTPVRNYGEDASRTDNNITVAVNKATLSADKRKVTIEPASLLTRRMYAITLNGTNIKSATGGNLYVTTGYYTLNNVSKSVPVDARRFATGHERPSIDLEHRNLRIQEANAYRLELRDASGRVLSKFQGQGPATLDMGKLPSGLILLTGESNGKIVQAKWVNRD